jgi:hypothetical protein
MSQPDLHTVGNRVAKSIGLGAMMLLLVGLFSGYPGTLFEIVVAFIYRSGIKPVLLNSSIFNDTCPSHLNFANCTELVEVELALIGMSPLFYPQLCLIV